MIRQLKIQENFLDYIESGLKKFEIRKDGDLQGIVELVVVKKGINTENGICWKLDCNEKTMVNCPNCVKKRMKVRLKKTKLNAYDIGVYITNQISSTGATFLTRNEKWNKEILGKRQMFNEVNDFLINENYFKQGDKLYLYELEKIEGEQND